MTTLLIRPALRDDASSIDVGVPAPGNFNSIRLERHLRGETLFLTAWLGDDCVGRAEVLWDGCQEPEVRQELGGVPEVNGIDVSVPHRGEGIGTALIRTAAGAAHQRGHARIGVGVDLTNEGAHRLYERLGFTGM